LTDIDQLLPVASDEQQDELMREKVRLQREIELSGQSSVKSFKFLRPRARHSSSSE
jgi:hypothetical protein